MLMERRMFNSPAWLECLTRSLHLYADCSPITGRELFAMVWDIFTNNYHHRLLPGSTVAHGYQRVIDKVMALLWALWLVTGAVATFLTVLFAVRSISTDQGSESLMAGMENVLEEFFKRIGVKYDPSMFPFRRLFPNAISVPDWSHLWSNAIKSAFETFPEWPKYLSRLRVLLEFLRNADYIDSARSFLRARGKPVEFVKRVTATIATWRYETLSTVFTQLLPSSEFSLPDLCAEMFAKSAKEWFPKLAEV